MLTETDFSLLQATPRLKAKKEGMRPVTLMLGGITICDIKSIVLVQVHDVP
jgi:hypothetical protein